MKKILITIGVAFIATISQAQIGNVIGDFIFTNSAVDIAGFRGTTGNKDIIASTYAKDITTNAAVLITYDRCFTPKHTSDFESDQLTGGLNLNTTWKWFTIGGYEEAGVVTSGNNNGQAVNVLGTYVDYQYKNFTIGLLYQNRVESDQYSGNYVGFHIAYRF